MPFCHTDGGGLITLGGFCDSNAKGIAKVRSASGDNARFIVSFLNGTADWQTIGQAAEQNQFLSANGGLDLRPLTASGSNLDLAGGAQFGGVVATFTDGNPSATAADFSASVDWGDGTGASGGTIGSSGGTEKAALIRVGGEPASWNVRFITWTCG